MFKEDNINFVNIIVENAAKVKTSDTSEMQSYLNAIAQLKKYTPDLEISNEVYIGDLFSSYEYALNTLVNMLIEFRRSVGMDNITIIDTHNTYAQESFSNIKINTNKEMLELWGKQLQYKNRIGEMLNSHLVDCNVELDNIDELFLAPINFKCSSAKLLERVANFK